MRPKMIATQPFNYASRALKVGETFEAENEAQAALLREIGKAREAEEETAGVQEPKRRYRRRDLRAES